MQSLIMAGGEGTRLGRKDLPKVMLEIGGIPILQHQIELLQRHGVTDIILCVKHLSGKIKEHFGNGEKFGVKITYSEEEDFLGTAGAIKLAEKFLEKDFIVLYGDVMLNINLNKLFEYHRKKGGIATLVVHESDHPHDSDIVGIDSDNRVKRIWRPKPNEKFRNLTNAAVFVLSRPITGRIPKSKFLNLEKDVLPGIIEEGVPVHAYETDEYVKDMGTPERLEKVKKDYESGRIFRPAVFLDRDGVINEDPELLYKPSQLKMIDGSAEGIKLLKDNGFLTVVVTNQPVVARNMCSEDDVHEIHEKLKEMLAKKGAKLDAIYYCPHHPDKGYPEENPRYKIDCECRKPKPGMIIQASRDFGINPRECFMIGDRNSDIKAGESAGCKTILVRTGKGENSRDFGARPDHVCENLLEAAKLIIKTHKPR